MTRGNPENPFVGSTTTGQQLRQHWLTRAPATQMTLNEQGLRLLQVLVTSVQLRDDSVSQDVLQKDMTASVPLLDGQSTTASGPRWHWARQVDCEIRIPARSHSALLASCYKHHSKMNHNFHYIFAPNHSQDRNYRLKRALYFHAFSCASFPKPHTIPRSQSFSCRLISWIWLARVVARSFQIA